MLGKLNTHILLNTHHFQCYNWYPCRLRYPWLSGSSKSTLRSRELKKPVSLFQSQPLCGNLCDLRRLLCHYGLILMFSSAYQRQWMQLAELLKRKIAQLSQEENNKKLSEHATQQNADVAPCLVSPWFDLFCFFLSKGDFGAADADGTSRKVNVRDHNWYRYPTQRWKVKNVMSAPKPLFLTTLSLFRAKKYIRGAEKTATEPAGTAWGRRVRPGTAAWVQDNYAHFWKNICQNKQHM